MDAFGSTVFAAVVVVVAEVPRFLWVKVVVAAPAADGEGRDDWFPSCAFLVVCGVVASLLPGSSLLLKVASVFEAASLWLKFWATGFSADVKAHVLCLCACRIVCIPKGQRCCA